MRIGYYAHHHGSGHCRQADKLAGLFQKAPDILPDTLKSQSPSAQISNPVNPSNSVNSSNSVNPSNHSNNINIFTVFTSRRDDQYRFNNLEADHIVRLPEEHETQGDVLHGRAGEHWQPSCLHYSPVGNHNIQSRSRILLQEIAQRQIDIMIIDVSVEVALLCRIASIPYLYVRLPGDRDDTPHVNAFAGAIGLLSFYPTILESQLTPDWVVGKTLSMGFLTATEPNTKSLSNLSKVNFLENLEALVKMNDINLKDKFIITVMKGYGGHESIDAKLPELYATLKANNTLKDTFILSLGPITDSAKAYVNAALEVEDVMPFLHHSDCIVMACGVNSVGEVCQFDTPLVVIPDERPHAEQQRMAQALIYCGRAVSFDDFTENLKSSKSINEFKSKQMATTNAKLVEKLQTQTFNEFIDSLVQYSDIKSWFYKWWLKKIALMPEKLNP